MKARDLPDSYSNPVLALELVKNGADIEQILRAESGQTATFIKRNTYKTSALSSFTRSRL